MNLNIEIVMSDKNRPVVKMTGLDRVHWEWEPIMLAINQRVYAMQEYCDTMFELNEFGIEVPKPKEDGIKLTDKQIEMENKALGILDEEKKVTGAPSMPELTKFKANGKTYYHSPELKTWNEWTELAKIHDYELLDIDELCNIPDKVLKRLPNILAGFRITDGTFYNRGKYAYVWTASVAGASAWTRALNSGNATGTRFAYNKAYGFSVILRLLNIK